MIDEKRLEEWAEYFGRLGAPYAEEQELVRLARLGLEVENCRWDHCPHQPLAKWAEEHAVPALEAAQERLETGQEVNRSPEHAPRVTATSCQIRYALAALPKPEPSDGEIYGRTSALDYLLRKDAERDTGEPEFRGGFVGRLGDSLPLPHRLFCLEPGHINTAGGCLVCDGRCTTQEPLPEGMGAFGWLVAALVIALVALLQWWAWG
jgi:hypothetical protein